MKHSLKISVLSFLFPLFAHAAAIPEGQGLVPCKGPDCDWCDLLQLIVNLINFAIYNIFFPLALLLILWGGIMMVSAGGKEENYKKGKEILKNTIIALVIILCAWFLVNALITTLAGSVSIEGFNPADWFKINCQ